MTSFDDHEISKLVHQADTRCRLEHGNLRPSDESCGQGRESRLPGKDFRCFFLLRLILVFKVYVWRFVSLNTVEHEIHCAANKQQQLQQQ